MKPTRAPALAMAAATLLVASQASATECFSMYDGKNQLIYQSSTAPIDLSRPVSDEMAARFPARYLVISDVGSCAPVDRQARTPTASAALLSMRAADARDDRYPLASDRAPMATTGRGSR